MPLTNVLVIDAQLPTSLVPFLRENFSIKAIHVNELKERRDEDIFFLARKMNALILTKDSDFEELVRIHKLPPKIIFIE